MGLRVEKNHSEYETNVDTHQRKQMYSLLNVLGLFIFVGWGLMIFSVPLDLNQKFEWIRVKEVHLDGEMMMNFFLCLITVGGLYFGLLFLYFNKMWGRSFVLIALCCLGAIDAILFFLVL